MGVRKEVAMFYFIKSNTYTSKQDGTIKCFVTLYDDRSKDILNCGPAPCITGADLGSFVSGLNFAVPVNVDLIFSTFNNSVRPQICSLSPLKEGK